MTEKKKIMKKNITDQSQMKILANLLYENRILPELIPINLMSIFLFEIMFLQF